MSLWSCRFLFDTNSEGYKYYAQKVEEYSRPPGFLANVPIPAPPAPANVETRSRRYGASALPTAAHQSLSTHGHHQPALPSSAPQQPPMPPGAPPGPSPRPPHPASGGSQVGSLPSVCVSFKLEGHLSYCDKHLVDDNSHVSICLA